MGFTLYLHFGGDYKFKPIHKNKKLNAKKFEIELNKHMLMTGLFSGMKGIDNNFKHAIADLLQEALHPDPDKRIELEDLIQKFELIRLQTLQNNVGVAAILPQIYQLAMKLRAELNDLQRGHYCACDTVYLRKMHDVFVAAFKQFQAYTKDVQLFNYFTSILGIKHIDKNANKIIKSYIKLVNKLESLLAKARAIKNANKNDKSIKNLIRDISDKLNKRNNLSLRFDNLYFLQQKFKTAVAVFEQKLNDFDSNICKANNQRERLKI